MLKKFPIKTKNLQLEALKKKAIYNHSGCDFKGQGRKQRTKSQKNCQLDTKLIK